MQFVDYLDRYSLFSNSQFRFRKNHSTKIYCLAMLDKIYKLDNAPGECFWYGKLCNLAQDAHLKVCVSSAAIFNIENSVRRLKMCFPDSFTWCAIWLNIDSFITFHIHDDSCQTVELCRPSMYADDTAIVYISEILMNWSLAWNMICNRYLIECCKIQ